jgi:hypothetical protein
VQAVHLVQAVQVRLQPLRPQCQQHGNAHQADGQHPAVLHEHGAKREIAERLGAQRIGGQPQRGQHQQDGDKSKLDALHA